MLDRIHQYKNAFKIVINSKGFAKMMDYYGNIYEPYKYFPFNKKATDTNAYIGRNDTDKGNVHINGVKLEMRIYDDYGFFLNTGSEQMPYFDLGDESYLRGKGVVSYGETEELGTVYTGNDLMQAQPRTIYAQSDYYGNTSVIVSQRLEGNEFETYIGSRQSYIYYKNGTYLSSGIYNPAWITKEDKKKWTLYLDVAQYEYYNDTDYTSCFILNACDSVENNGFRIFYTRPYDNYENNVWHVVPGIVFFKDGEK